MATNSDPRLPPQWAEMLAHMDEALKAALEAADRRERASRPPEPAPPPAADLTEGLARFRERLRGLSECAAGADRTVASVDADLAACEDGLRNWLQAAEEVRRKLADGAARV